MRAGYGCDAESGPHVCVRVCARHRAPAFLPTAARLVPLLDGDPFAGRLPVIVADCHDELAGQEAIACKLLAALDDEQPLDAGALPTRASAKSLALTLWAAEGNGVAHACDTFACCGAGARALPLRSPAPGLFHWHCDGGALVSTARWRATLRATVGAAGTFAAFLERFASAFAFARGAEEIALDWYLSQPPVLSLCRAHAVAHMHPILAARAPPPPPSAHPPPPPPPRTPRYGRPPARRALELEREHRLRGAALAAADGWLEWLHPDEQAHAREARRAKRARCADATADATGA